MNKLIAKTFHIHSEPKLAESLLQQKANLIFSALTVAVNDKIQDPYLHTPNAGQNLLIFYIETGKAALLLDHLSLGRALRQPTKKKKTRLFVQLTNYG